MKSILLGMLSVALAAVALAGDEVRDGNWWRSQPKMMKVAYVLGMFDGDQKLQTAATAGQFSDGLDSFYLDFTNRSISLPRAARIVAMSINGESAEKIQRAISLDRWAAKEGL